MSNQPPSVRHPDRFLLPPGQITVRANPHFPPAFNEGVQCGGVLYISADLHRELASLVPASRQAVLAELDVMFWPALGAAGETRLLFAPKLNLG